MSQRLNYNTIAHQYYAHPDRRKKVDEDLIAFTEARQNVRALDIGCGTRSQNIVNHFEKPYLLYVGLDYHIGILQPY